MGAKRNLGYWVLITLQDDPTDCVTYHIRNYSNAKTLQQPSHIQKRNILHRWMKICRQNGMLPTPLTQFGIKNFER